MFYSSVMKSEGSDTVFQNRSSKALQTKQVTFGLMINRCVKMFKRNCQRGRISSPLQGLSGWAKNHINMRQINRRKSSLISYIGGIHTNVEIPKTDKMRYVCHSEIREQGSWTSVGKKAIRRKGKDRKCLVNECLPGHSESVGQRGF